mmetsp:Transcript_26583/g.48075  ORF Transcript_26583/g.48075 Transcript_26583/m.48075 type:complete len:99 (+) Transcript_26583:1997-2293(+)
MVMRATTLSNPNQTMYSSCTRLLLCGETMAIDDALQAATNRLYLVGRRFDHGPRGCKCRLWMQIILSILLCTRSCVVIRHSFMTVTAELHASASRLLL